MVDPRTILPGTIIYVVVWGIFCHRGIVSDRRQNGVPMVIANARDTQGVAEVPLEKFTTGPPCFVEGYPSELPPEEVLYRARCMLGKPYDLLRFNCEHFVSVCHGKRPSSPQVGAVALLVAVGFLAAAAQG
jgi:Lecithin retinol acyltransferase